MRNPTHKVLMDKFELYIYPSTSTITLAQKFRKRKNNFIDVVLGRRSSMPRSPISLAEISELLFYSAKVQEIQKDETGFWISKRVAPSAGARHPIDILVSYIDPFGIRKLTYYNPIDHTLNELDISGSILKRFFDEINSNVPIANNCIIWFSIQPEKTSSKYDNPESLYWRDSGALLYCIQLVATYLGFSSCPIGTLAASSFHKLLGSNKLLSGGGILIGKKSI